MANPYLNAGAERTVEPHLSLEESWFGLRADITPGVWERSIETDIEGHAARALCPSDLMLHLCIHLSFHLIMGWPSLVQLLDLLWVSRRLEEADWEQVSRRAIDRSVAGFIYAALRLARVALAAPVPEKVLARLAAATPAAVRAHAETLTAEDVMRRAQRPPLTTIRRRLARSVHDRAETARWAGTLQERLAVWRHAHRRGAYRHGQTPGCEASPGSRPQPVETQNSASLRLRPHVNRARAAQAGFDGALDPAVRQRAVLAGEVEPAFRGDDVGV